MFWVCRSNNILCRYKLWCCPLGSSLRSPVTHVRHKIRLCRSKNLCDEMTQSAAFLQRPKDAWTVGCPEAVTRWLNPGCLRTAGSLFWRHLGLHAPWSIAEGPLQSSSGIKRGTALFGNHLLWSWCRSQKWRRRTHVFIYIPIHCVLFGKYNK